MSRRHQQNKLGGKFIPLMHSLLDSDAWAALGLPARVLYISLRRRARPEINGKVHLSVRDAAQEMGVARNTATAAFHDLQAKGLIRASRIGTLGVEGQGRASEWRLTELGTPADPKPTKDFLAWRPGCDFPVEKGRAPTPKKQNPVSNSVHPCRSDCDDFSEPVAMVETPCRNH